MKTSSHLQQLRSLPVVLSAVIAITGAVYFTLFVWYGRIEILGPERYESFHGPSIELLGFVESQYLVMERGLSSPEERLPIYRGLGGVGRQEALLGTWVDSIGALIESFGGEQYAGTSRRLQSSVTTLIDAMRAVGGPSDLERVRLAGDGLILRVEQTRRLHDLEIAEAIRVRRERGDLLRGWTWFLSFAIGVPAVFIGYRVVSRIRELVSALAEAQVELRGSLDQKDVLLKEIHHRVKNNIQVISSMLTLQEHMSDDPSVRASFREGRRRLSAMAAVHEQLHKKKSFEAVDLPPYLEDVVTNVLRGVTGMGNRITADIEADPGLIHVDQATPMGLIVSELVCNALEHGFPDQRRGHVQVTAKCRGGGLTYLAVKDDGVGCPDIGSKGSNSLGLMLVEKLVEQLGGDLRIVNGNGLEVVVDLSGP